MLEVDEIRLVMNRVIIVTQVEI